MHTSFIRAFEKIVPSLRLLRRDRRGATAILTALGATMLMGFAGLATDVVIWEMNGRKAQGAADEAALAGAVAESANYNVNSAIYAAAASNGFANGQNGVTVTPTLNSNGSITVQIAQIQPQYFTRLFLKSAPTLNVQAVAQPLGPQSNGQMCVLALDQTGKLAIGSIAFPSNTTVNLDCELYNNSGASNSTELTGGSDLTALDVFLSGGYTIDNNATMSISGTLATYVTPTPDPYKNFTISQSGSSVTIYDPDTGNTLNYGSGQCNQGSVSQKWNVSASMTITPGNSSPYVICGGLTVNAGVTLTLNAGTYVIDGGKLHVNGGATLVGNGVTIVLTSSSGSYPTTWVQFDGNSTETITAPAVGASAGLQGMAIWVDKNVPEASDNLTGQGTQVINGAVYMPTQDVTWAGGSQQAVNNVTTGCNQLVALTVTFSGGSYFTHAYCSSWDLPVKNPLAPPKLSS